MSSELAIDRVLTALEAQGARYRKQANGNYSARCPHHEGKGETSLSVRQIEGCALVNCFAGCSPSDVVSSLGLTLADLFDDRREQSYSYTDASGRVTRTVYRAPDKRFRQSGDTKRVDLYRLPKVIEAVRSGRKIYLVEGEQDVHTLESLGEVATTAPMGGGNFGKVDVSPLKQATVIAIADNDATGQKWAESVYTRLGGYAKSLTWQRARVGKDVTDHVMRGHHLGDLVVTGVPGTGPWGKPVPLGWRPSRLPDFPVDCLPPTYRDYVVALAESTQTPADIPGTVVLGSIAVAVGGKATVRPHGDWVEPVNLWVVPVAPPASRKSAVIAAATQPLREAETQLGAEQADEIRDAEIRHKVLTSRAEKAKDVAVKQGDETSIQLAIDAAKEAEQATPKPYPRLIVQDATPEVLISRMVDQEGRIAGISAEAGIFDSLSGRYQKEKFLDHLLSSHAGDQILVDRQTREPERIDHPALTLIACMQPYAVKEMVSREDYAGRGLLARVLWSIAKDNVGFRDVEPNPVPRTVKDAYTTDLRELTVGLAKRTEVTQLTLDTEAKALIVDFHRRLEMQLRPNERLGSSLLRGWGGKGHGVAARLAGCLHVARHGLTRTVIDADTMSRAVRLASYFTGHAITALGGGDGDLRSKEIRSVLETLIKKIVGDRKGRTFTSRELQRALPRPYRNDSESVANVLDVLMDGGWVRQSKAKGQLELHPQALEFLDAGDSGDNGDKDPAIAGQNARPMSPETVTRGDTSGNDTGKTSILSPHVTKGGDTSIDNLSSDNASPDSAVISVTTSSHSGNDVVDHGHAPTSVSRDNLWSDDPEWAELLATAPDSAGDNQDVPDDAEWLEWSA